MKLRLNIPGLTLLALTMAGCGDAPGSGPTETVLPGDQAVTRPEIESPQAVPPLDTATASTAEPSASTTAPTDAGAASTPAATGTPSSQPAAGTTTTGTEFARFTGRITVNGAVPQLAPLVQAGDPAVKDKVCVASAIPNESLIVGPDSGLADVFVYAKRVPDGVDVPAPPEQPAVLDQKGCRFIPQALAFRVDQPLQMANSDPVAHNVRTAGFTKQLNQIVPANDQEGITVTYDRAERTPVQTKCDIHTWMLAWHLPLDHPWATVSEENGTFVIDDLPAGDWEFILWHGRTGYVERSVKFTAAAGQVIEMNFAVPAADLQ